MTRKGYRRAKIALSIFLAFFLFLFCVATGLLIASLLVDRTAHRIPAYPREDISALVAKPEWSEEDYNTIYLQTGLGKPAADALRAKGATGDLLLYQDDLFFEGDLVHEFTVDTVTTLHDMLYEKGTEKLHRAKFAPLEEGDVIVSSSCHTVGWRNGHAALVTNASSQNVLESLALGLKSQISYGGAVWFAEAANFIVLRLKGATKEERKEIATRAASELLGVDYSLTVGIFSPKDQCKNGAKAKGTNCAHLVWQAYKNFGYDIDGDGGLICTVHDIAQSDLFEVVQVYGFDPQNIW